MSIHVISALAGETPGTAWRRPRDGDRGAGAPVGSCRSPAVRHLHKGRTGIVLRMRTRAATSAAAVPPPPAAGSCTSLFRWRPVQSGTPAPCALPGETAGGNCRGKPPGEACGASDETNAIGSETVDTDHAPASAEPAIRTPASSCPDDILNREVEDMAGREPATGPNLARGLDLARRSPPSSPMIMPKPGLYPAGRRAGR